jgi:predicted extracellular nuclease
MIPRLKVKSPLTLALLALGCARSLEREPASGSAIAIPAIQGRGHISPRIGQVVTTIGIVTAATHNGFYLQDRIGDGDDATSDALFVFTPNGPGVTAGDEVRVSGRVTEFIPGDSASGNLSITQISASPLVTILSRHRPLPHPVRLGAGGRVPPASFVITPIRSRVNLQVKADADRYGFRPETAGLDFYESLEGMLVTVPSPVAVSGTRGFGPRTAEVFTLPENGRYVEPQNARTGRGGIYLQPDPQDRGDQNPEIVQIQLDPDLFAGSIPSIAVGDRLSDVTGVMGYDYGSFQVNAMGSLRVLSHGLRPDTTSLVGTPEKFTLATYNVLNLSATDDDADQRAKLGTQIVHNLRSPDILALQEIQDNNGETDDGTTDASQTLRGLTQAIELAGGPRYAALDVAPIDGTLGGAPGGNIRPAFLYNPARVRLITYESLTAAVLGRAGISDSLAFTDSRNPLAAIFQFDGHQFTLINNHLSSRYGSTPVFGAIQPFVQAGEDKRAAQTRALHDFVAGLLSRTKGTQVAVLGDMNTFEFTDDLTSILPGSDHILTNLVIKAPAGDRYSYNFQGNSQLIDHIFVTANLLDRAELEEVHINVDFPTIGTAEASDHDPVVARLE